MDSMPDLNIMRQDVPPHLLPRPRPMAPEKPKPPEKPKESAPRRIRLQRIMLDGSAPQQSRKPENPEGPEKPEKSKEPEKPEKSKEPMSQSLKSQRSQDPQSPLLSCTEIQPSSDPHTPSLSNPVAQPQSPPCPWQPKLPCEDLLVGRRANYIKIGVPLYEASIKGDWATAENILYNQPEFVRCAITENYETALHVAASVEDNKLMEHFVQKLVDKMDKQDLALQNLNQNTALSLAAAAGSVKLAEIMVKKNSKLPEIPGSEGMMPLYFAAMFGKHDMVKYLYNDTGKMNGNYWTDHNRGLVLQRCVEADMFDVAQDIMKDHPELTTKMNILRHLLLVLAQKRDAFKRSEENIIRRIIHSIHQRIHEKDGDALELLRFIWGKINIMPTNEIADILNGPASTNQGAQNSTEETPCAKDSSRILFVAAKMGNTRFIIELISGYPDLIWKKNDDGVTIFHIAVMHRHQGIYNLLYEIGSMRDLITPMMSKHKNNMLHLVGMTSKQMRPHMSGASLPMQRELLWYKEVEKMMPPSYREQKNTNGKTPYELFSENNKDLVSQGLKWMKDCMVVATLIVTVAFAVAFTVPGGYNQNNGIPMFVHDRAFLVFVIADAISLVCSSASLLVFLSILTSRHGERDFMSSLPTKLMIGLASLFISVTAMMVIFSVSFFVLYHKRLKWLPILISVFATGPIILFAILQVPMLVDMFRSKYDERYLFKPKKRMLYNINPRS